MSSVNKESVREEVERIKLEFERLSAEKKIPTEIKALMQCMLTLMQLLISIFLERATKKNSRNSSLPSSQTEDDTSSDTDKGAKGKGKPEDKKLAANTRLKETISIATVAHCDICGQDLSDVPCEHHERRTKIDIVFEKVVEHIDAEVKVCPECDSTIKGTFPADMPGPLQYGNGIKAFVINLLVSQMVALRRTQKLVASLIGSVISEATMLKFILRLYQALEQWEANAKELILNSPVLHVDETSLRVDKKNHWIHVCSAGDITLKFLHPKRGKAGHAGDAAGWFI